VTSLLPASRPLLGPLRPLESARTRLRELPDGRFEATIAHAPLAGVTPPMIEWFLRNMSHPMELRGQTLKGYLWWHPHDHIDFNVTRRAPDGTVGAGARFHIQEAFARDPRYLVDEVLDVPRLDPGGITLEQRRLGQQVFRLAHTFTPIAGGTRYDSSMVIGSDAWWFKGVVNLLRKRRFPVDKQQVWLRHNVEETGYFERFLPELYDRYGGRSLGG